MAQSLRLPDRDRLSQKNQLPTLRAVTGAGPISLMPPEPMPRGPSLLRNSLALLAGVSAGRSEHEYLPGECIFLQGQPANAVFFIEHGEVKLSVVARNGKQAIVDILGEHAFFGEGCLAGEPVRVATAVAVQRSIVVRLEKRALLGLFRRVPVVAEEFITQLASRNLRMQADLADHIFNSSEKRLARLLINMARIGPRSADFAPIPRTSQETLAEMVGTTRSRVSFFLNRFRECGFISYDRSAIHVHRSLLTVLATGQADEPAPDPAPESPCA